MKVLGPGNVLPVPPDIVCRNRDSAGIRFLRYRRPSEGRLPRPSLPMTKPPKPTKTVLEVLGILPLGPAKEFNIRNVRSRGDLL